MSAAGRRPGAGKSAMDKKREAAAAAYLANKAKLKAKVEDKMVKETLSNLEQGIAPTNEVELEMATRQLERKEVVEKMQTAAESREQLQSRKGEAGLIVGSTATATGGVLSYADLQRQHLLEQQGAIIAPAAKKSFLILDEEEVQQRIDNGEAPKAEMTYEEKQEAKQAAVLTAAERMQAFRKTLPMYRKRDELLKAVNENQVIILKGATGSGKTTQMLQYLYEEGFAREVSTAKLNEDSGEEEILTKKLKLACTQPRRLAATGVATRVAEEVGCSLGTTVGYKVRFEQKTSDKTLIEFLTDGMLIKTFSESPQLDDYGVIMIDEAHERSVPTDILLGLLKEITKASGGNNKKAPVIPALAKSTGADQEEEEVIDFYGDEGDSAPPPTKSDPLVPSTKILPDRSDLRIIIASATMNVERFSKFFNDAPIVEVEGKMYDVGLTYAKNPVDDYVEGAATAVVDIHLNQELPGDILVFMPGQEQIENCKLMIEEKIEEIGEGKVRPLLIRPVYANLPQEQQNLIYQKTPEDSRKVVIATNIAETSITIDGIVYVVDTGLCKQNYYDPSAKMEKLSVVPISRAQADQRKGRAGRTQEGDCIRLYTKSMFFSEMPKDTVPDIKRSNLASIMLSLKSIGVDDVLSFEFVTPPAPEPVVAALDQLHTLGALNDEGNLTKTGRRMAEFPIDPCLAKCLVKTKSYGCSREVAACSALLTLQNGVFMPIPKKDKSKEERFLSVRRDFFQGGAGDITGYFRLFNTWEFRNGYSERWCRERFINYQSLMRAKDVRDQLLSVLERLGLPVESIADTANARDADTAVTQCMCEGFFLNAAKLNLDGKTYHVIRTKLNNSEVKIHPSSFLINEQPRPDLVIFSELREMKEVGYMMHLLSVPVEFLYPIDLTLSLMRKEKTGKEKVQYEEDLKMQRGGALAESRAREKLAEKRLAAEKELAENGGEEEPVDPKVFEAKLVGKVVSEMKAQCVAPKDHFTKVELGLK